MRKNTTLSRGLGTETERAVKKIREKEEAEAQKELAAALKLPFINLALVPINREVITLVPKERALEAQLVIFSKKGDLAHIGIVNPKKKETQDLLRELKEQKIEYKLFVVTETALERVLGRYPMVHTRGPSIQGTMSVNHELIQNIQETVKTLEELRETLATHEEGATREVLEALLAGGLAFNASDIHIEAEEKESKVRYRIDGVLNDIALLKHEAHGLLLSRIKILSHLLLNIHDTSQDGHFTIKSGEEEIEIRVSIIPAEYKESVVLRILNPKLLFSVHELGLRKDLEEKIKEKIQAPYGMILITGPTGSGKTTTLYAFVEFIKKTSIKIITIEDPIEYRINDVAQSQVNPQKGYDFPHALRAILRQDPDVILVGEMRDAETVSTSLNAALTGHLVFSTLHTNDAAGAIPRLIDLKANPSLVSPALDVVIAQRLVRKLCSFCKKERDVSADELKKIRTYFKTTPPEIEKEAEAIKPGARIWEAKGCPKCLEGGYKGRIGIFEVLIVDEEIERMILSSPTITDLRRVAKEKGMTTMMQDGILKVLQGITSLGEIYRVTQ